MARDFSTEAKFPEVQRGDPRVDGPYLDDIREDQERANREGRTVPALVKPTTPKSKKVKTTNKRKMAEEGEVKPVAKKSVAKKSVAKKAVKKVVKKSTAKAKK